MRAYINGTLTNKQDCFLIQDLFFANENTEDNTIASENCIHLEGILCESFVDGNSFSCRWKGVTLTNEKEHDEDFTINELRSVIKERNLILQNISAFFDKDTYVAIDSIRFEGPDEVFELRCTVDPIEMIA